MILYNVFTCSEGFTVTKWDHDFNVESSYIVNQAKSICNCPSRTIPCKHITLVQLAEARGFIDTYNYYEFETAHWVVVFPQVLMPEGKTVNLLIDQPAQSIPSAPDITRVRRRI